MITQNKKTHTLHLAGYSPPNKFIDVKTSSRDDQEAEIAMQSEGRNAQLTDEELLPNNWRPDV